MLGDLLVEGLVRGVEDAQQRDRQNWQEWGIDEELGRLETVIDRRDRAPARLGEREDALQLRSSPERGAVGA